MMMDRVRMAVWRTMALWGFVAACSSGPLQNTDPAVFYKRDLRLWVNGHEYSGVAVVPREPNYTIEGASFGNLNLLTITSCHREYSAELNSRRFVYQYDPAPGIEDVGSCPLTITGYDKNGRNAWGTVEFETQEASLPSLQRCNGETVQDGGVSICQSAAGLVQEIEFEQEVLTSPDPECNYGGKLPQRGKIFRYKVPVKECVLVFMEAEGEGRVHRHLTVGYEQVLLRKE